MTTFKNPDYATMQPEILAKLAQKYRQSRQFNAKNEARRYSLLEVSNKQGAMLSHTIKLQSPARINEKTDEVEAPVYTLHFDQENALFTCDCGDYTGRVAPMNAALMVANLPAELCQCKHAEMLPALDEAASEARKAARILAELQERVEMGDRFQERIAEALGLELGGEIGPDELVDTAAYAAQQSQQVVAVQTSLNGSLARVERLTAANNKLAEDLKIERENVRLQADMLDEVERTAAEREALVRRRFNALPVPAKRAFLSA